MQVTCDCSLHMCAKRIHFTLIIETINGGYFIYCLIVDFVFKITHGVYLYMVEASPYFVVMNKKTPTVSLIIFFIK